MITPTREVVPPFGWTVNWTAPLPVPLAAEVKVIQAGMLAVSTVHPQLADEPKPKPTLNWPGPPAARAVPAVGLSENLQTTAALTVTVTGMFAGEFEAPAEVNVTVPLWVPAARRVGLILTLGELGVVPAPEERLIQPPPLSPLALAV